MTSRNTKEEERKSPSQPVLTIGAIAGFTTLGAYLTAFMHEWGFTHYFRIPAQFITLDWTTVLVAAVAVLYVLLMTIIFVNTISPLFWPRQGPIENALFRTVFMSVLFGLPLYFLASGWVYLAVAGIPILWAFTEFVFPYLAHRGKGTYKERLALYQERSFEADRTDRHLLGQVPRNLFLLMFMLLWICLLAWAMGTSSARGQKEFLVVNTSPEAVVLRPYHDHLVCAYFDRETKEVSREYFILKTAGDPETILTPEKVGPLHIKKD